MEKAEDLLVKSVKRTGHSVKEEVMVRIGLGIYISSVAKCSLLPYHQRSVRPCSHLFRFAFRSRSTRSCSDHTCNNLPDPFRLRASDAFTLVPERVRLAHPHHTSWCLGYFFNFTASNIHIKPTKLFIFAQKSL